MRGFFDRPVLGSGPSGFETRILGGPGSVVVAGTKAGTSSRFMRSSSTVDREGARREAP